MAHAQPQLDSWVYEWCHRFATRLKWTRMAVYSARCEVREPFEMVSSSLPCSCGSRLSCRTGAAAERGAH